ncbi:MAG: FAD-dependent 5-carboxymethylaminomethyl-2-thiouridine(34) oxidoreductase MnmC, partial [Rubrivivax sp.]
PQRLHVVALAACSLTPSALAGAHALTPWPDGAAALRAHWPPAWNGLHSIDLDEGRVQLLLGFGEVGPLLRALDVQADALLLDADPLLAAPGSSAAPLLRTLARHLRVGATAVFGTDVPGVRDGLQAAGFELIDGPTDGGPGHAGWLRARLAPRRGRRSSVARGHDDDDATAARSAIVLGAGLAGAWAARALVRQGWSVRVFDRHAAPAAEASGNPAGLFHATVHAGDGRHARWHRAAARRTAQWLRPCIAAGALPGAVDGLLRLAPAAVDNGHDHDHDDDGGAEWLARMRTLDVPPELAEPLGPAAASARAGIPLARAGWWFPDGGWVDPGALVRHLLGTPGIIFNGGTDVAALRRDGADWSLLDAAGRTLAITRTLVLANAADAARRWPAAAWPLVRSRGQIGTWSAALAAAHDAPRPRVPLAGDGYLIAHPDGALTAGATSAPDDDDPRRRPDDDEFNRSRLARLAGWGAAPLPDGARVGWRAQTPDRLPMVGPVPAALPGGTPTAPLRAQAREPGLFVLSGFGGRGLTWGPLAAEVLAAWITGAPMPVEARLRDAVDPARWRVRAARLAPPGAG